MNHKVISILIFVTIAAILVVGGYKVVADPSSNSALVTDQPAASGEVHASSEVPADIKAHIDSKKDMIALDRPLAGTLVASPLEVSGKARGGWYQEGSFTVQLVDWYGNPIAETSAAAQGEWMTEEFVPFSLTLYFSQPTLSDGANKMGMLVFKKANPSGLEENDDTLEIPVRFE